MQCRSQLQASDRLGFWARAFACSLACLGSALPAAAAVQISQVYGGGGNNGGLFNADFVELRNTGTTAVSLQGWSLQYASATGSSWGGGQLTALSGSIPAGGYYLIKLATGTNQLAFAVLEGDRVVGCTSWYGIEPGNRAIAIGYTYLAPWVRGSGFNFAVKAAMVRHAWALGFHRIHFDVDVRNTRSQAAIRKLGAKQEGILRRNKITWTGHVRDTVILSLLPGEESDALKAWL